MKKYRKKTLIEVTQILENGDVWVQNENDPSDQWIIPKETFETTYEKVGE